MLEYNKTMLNHAFLIIAHDSPELLERIIGKIKAPNHYIFIHLDQKADIGKFEYIASMGGVIFTERINVTHGGFSQVMAELILLKAAHYFPVHIDYFHLISGHDYPCVSNNDFDEFFSTNRGRSYMHFDSDTEHVKWKEKIEARYKYWYHLEDYGWNKHLAKLLCGVLNKLYKKKITVDFFAGWQWFSWHRSVVDYVLTYMAENPKCILPYKYTSCFDEVFFHTLLHNKIDELNIEKNDALRYIDWYPKREYDTLPLVLDERDYADIEASGKFFIRKVFLNRSDKLLDMLDKDLRV